MQDDRRGVASVLLTLCFVTGLALLAGGAWMAWRPAGLLVGGLVLVAVPVFYLRGSRAAS